MSSYFISDLHLDPQRPDISRAFLRWLSQLPETTDSLYILGDLFEAWIGDDFENDLILQVKSQLRQLSDSGIELAFMHGNRDFLIGPDFADQIGGQLLADPSLITLYGRRILLMHGDSLCTRDTEYQQFRKQARNPQWQAEFLSKPLDERIEIAQQLRLASKEKTAGKQDYIMDVTEAEVEKIMLLHQTDLLIHGHTHRPNCHQLTLDNQTGQRWVLGDWDKNIWALEFDGLDFKTHVSPLADFL